MKLLVVLVVLMAVSAVYSFPVDETVEIEDWEDYEGDNEGVRQRRFTCDVLTFGGVVGDSACAANCLSMGKAGGRCNDSICQCRTTTLKEVWDRRFG